MGCYMRILSLAIGAFVLLLMAFPAFAHHRPDHTGGPGTATNQCVNDNTAGDNDACGGGGQKPGASQLEEGDCNREEAGNHGQYVSCVAHSAGGGGGDVEAEDVGLDDCDGNIVSCAAHSDAGKEDQGGASA